MDKDRWHYFEMHKFEILRNRIGTNRTYALWHYAFNQRTFKFLQIQAWSTALDYRHQIIEVLTKTK